MKKFLACLALSGSVAFAASDLSSPLIPQAEQTTPHATTFTLDQEGYQALLGVQSVVMTDFVLADGVEATLRLSRRNVFAPGAELLLMTDDGEVRLEQPEMAMFGGYIDGDPDSTVFLSFSPFGVEGFIDAMGQTWIISSGAYADELPIAIFNLTALPEGIINWAEFQCNADQLDQNMRPIDPQGGQSPRGVGGCFNIDFAIETDQEYLGIFSGNQIAANTYLATLWGAMTEIYTRDVNTTLTVVWTRLWTTTDPWNSGNTTDQLFQYRDYWQANMGSVQRDLGHFISGRGLGGGVAWLPGICGGQFAYGLSANMNGFFPYPIQNNSSQNWDLMVVSHEIGHNVGAPHTHQATPVIDGCGNGNCNVGQNGTIMSYCHTCPGGMSNVRMEFHPLTIDNGGGPGASIMPTLNDSNCGLQTACSGIAFVFPNGLPAFAQPNGSTVLLVDAVGAVDQPVPGTGMLHYDNGSGFTAVAMTENSPNSYSVNLPATACGGNIEYFVSAMASDGNTYYSPSNGSNTVPVATSVATYIDLNFEIAGGWSVQNIAVTDGGWERGIPAGDGSRQDPTSDYDGSGQCWLTGNRPGNSDLDGGPTILNSPIFDLSMTINPTLRVARWFQLATTNDDTFSIEVSDNGGSTWVVANSVTGSVSGWNLVTFQISNYVSLNNQFRVRFVTSDNPNNSVLEAAIDALRISEMICAPACPADWNGDGVLDFFDVQAFLADFSAQNPDADLNGDGNFDFFDVQIYLGIVSAGC